MVLVHGRQVFNLRPIFLIFTQILSSSLGMTIRVEYFRRWVSSHIHTSLSVGCVQCSRPTAAQIALLDPPDIEAPTLGETSIYASTWAQARCPNSEGV
jgi:hypothetical protein